MLIPTDESFVFVRCLVFFMEVRVFSPFSCAFTLFFDGGYFVMIHAFIGGFRFGLDAALIEIKSLFFGLVILVWTVDLAEFKI